MAGSFSEVGNFVARGANHVDPRLVDILQKAANAAGVQVQAFSGYRPGDKRFHGKGIATDVRLIGPDGKEISNYQDPKSFAAYEKFAQAARQVQMQNYPELEKQFRWGGYFSGGKGKYGAMDLMHFDLGGGNGLGMAGGSWDKGLNPKQAALWGMQPGIQGNYAVAGNDPVQEVLDAGNGLTAFAGQPRQSPAANALNQLAMAGLQPNHVQTVDYVPPPGSSQQPVFTPLIANPVAPRQDRQQQQNVAPEPPVAPQQAPNYDDLMKQFGLTNDQPEQVQTQQPSADPNAEIMKAWGLDQTDAAPAEAMTKAKDVAPQSGDSKIGVNDVVRSIATGVPIIGGALNKADAALNAAIAPVVNPMLSKEDQLQGDTWSERYKNSLAQQEGMDALYAKDHPIANAAGNIVGGVAATVPMIAAAPAVMGASSTAPLAQNMLLGGLSGAGIGAADAGVRTDGDLRSMGKSALIGGGLGVAGPAVAKGAGWVGNKLVSGISKLTPSGAASNNLKAALAASGKTPDDIALEMATNPRLTAMDVDPNIQQIGSNLANQNGPSRSVLKSAVDARTAGAKGAVEGAFDSAMGQTPDVKAYLDSLKQTAKTNASKGFTDALSNAKPVDVSPVIDAIDAKINPGINGVVSQGSELPQGPVEQALARVKALLTNGKETLTDPQRLHQIQSDLRVQADTLAKSANGQDKLVAKALNDVRQNIVGQIDDAAGGKYRPAQKQYATDMSIEDAFDKGRTILNGGTSSDAALMNRPEYWQDWMKNASPDEVKAARLGARVAIDNQINSVRSAAAKGAAVPDVGFNRDRLEILIGKKETDRLAKVLSDEQRIAYTNNRLFGNSATAERTAVNDLTKVTQVQPGISLTTPMAIGGGYSVGGIPGAAAGAALSLGRKGAQMALAARDVARNRLMAEAISGAPARFLDVASGNPLVGRIGPAIEGGTNRLLAATRPTVTREAIDRRVPVNVPMVKKQPLEITVHPKKR